MTNPRNREQSRAMRAYKRAHPHITLDQARQAVAAQTGRQQGLPARIPAALLPRPAERLDAYEVGVGAVGPAAVALEFPRGGQAQGERIEVDDVAHAPGPTQAQLSLAAVEIGSLELGELAWEEGVDGDEGDHEAVARVIEAVEQAGDAVGGQRGRHGSAAGEGDAAGGIAEDEAFTLERPEQRAQ